MNVSASGNNISHIPVDASRRAGYSKMYGSRLDSSTQVYEGIASVRRLVRSDFAALDKLKDEFAQVHLVDRYIGSRHGSKRVKGVYCYDSEGNCLVSLPDLVLFGDANIVSATTAFLRYLGYIDSDIYRLYDKVRNSSKMRENAVLTEEYDYTIVLNFK